MAQQAKITIHPDFPVGEISPRLFSAFLEPIGTMVNGTMYNPKHPTADEQGFRRDFIEGLKSTHLPAVRLPGGNFVSAWQWKDSIGPMAERKVHLDPAWHQIIPNDVGFDEYMQWAEKVGTEALVTANFGTGTLQDAMDLVEYTNFEGGTYWSDLRRKNGHEAPYNAKVWYLGNEMDGHWQLGSWEKDPVGYGLRCQEASKAMKWIDERIETAVCGSSSPFMEHFPEWDEKALDICYDTVDYLSVHHYHNAAPGDMRALLGGAEYYDDFLTTEAAMIDYVASKHRSPKKVMISLDEYGAICRPFAELHPGYGRYNMARSHYHFDPERKYVRHDPDHMTDRVFPGGDMSHLLSMASIQLSLLRHADRVAIGCMTGGLGALCASNHDHVWRAASYYAFTDLIRYAKGTSMQTKIDCETFDLPGYFIDDTSQYTGKEGVGFVDGASAWDRENGRLTIFLINRNGDADYPVQIDVRGFAGFTKVHQSVMENPDPEAKNSFEAQMIAPAEATDCKLEDGIVSARCKPLSWNVIILE
ncbi:MAG: alpha-L-arabinofuranosidase [Lachnospiraceae bacterium]|nr:alpha-L-arabinofuranosidase [Lachnospiraceae bacterium]